LIFFDIIIFLCLKELLINETEKSDDPCTNLLTRMGLFCLFYYFLVLLMIHEFITQNAILSYGFTIYSMVKSWLNLLVCVNCWIIHILISLIHFIVF